MLFHLKVEEVKEKLHILNFELCVTQKLQWTQTLN